MVRARYLENGLNSDGNRRGKEPFVPVSWDTALDLTGSNIEQLQRDARTAPIGSP
jgi:biotin/methionine sulfoxide reductase